MCLKKIIFFTKIEIKRILLTYTGSVLVFAIIAAKPLRIPMSCGLFGSNPLVNCADTVSEVIPGLGSLNEISIYIYSEQLQFEVEAICH